MPCGVMICSLCENNREEHIRFHVIVDNEVTEANKQLLQTTVDAYGNDIAFYDMSGKDRARFTIGGGNLEHSHLTVSTYYRLLAEDILPSDVHRVIYLDCDMIVRRSLATLQKMDLEGKAVAAVPDLSEAMPERYSRLGYPMEKGYFNAGLLVINLDFWREHHLREVFLDFFKGNHQKCRQHDQDVLNVCCQDSKVVLPLKYNSQDGFYYRRKYIDVNRYNGQWEEALTNPVVLHFTANKPWEVECDFPYKDEFFKYQALTVWKGTPLVHAKCPLTARQQLVKCLRPAHSLPYRYQLLVQHLIKK